MNNYLEDGGSNKKLANELADENAELHFTTLNSKVIGYLKLISDNRRQNLKPTRHLKLKEYMYSKNFMAKSWTTTVRKSNRGS